MVRLMPFLRHLLYFPLLLGLTGAVAGIPAASCHAAIARDSAGSLATAQAGERQESFLNKTGSARATTPVIEIANEPYQFLAAQGEEQTQFYVIYFNDFPPGQSASISVLDPSGSFTISTEETGAFSPTLEIKPNVDGSLDDVTVYLKYKPTDDRDHLATLSHSSAGTETQTFQVEGYPPLVPLPVQLISFKASKQESSVVFDWRAAPDDDLSHFELEASSDPQLDFYTIGTLNCLPQNAIAETDYHFIYHPVSETPRMYYRLAQVYFNHSTLYSKIVMVEIPPVLKTSVVAYPTPFQATLQLHVASKEAGLLKVALHTLQGKEVFCQSYQVQGGENKLALNTSQVQASGIYLLSATLSGSVYTFKVVKL